MNIIEQLKIALQILKAKEAGEPIEWEYKTENSSGIRWIDQGNSTTYLTCALNDEFEIRLKPWTLGRSINGHTLPDGAKWHRQDWIQAMLPPPYRPLLPVEFDNQIYNDIERAGKSLCFANGEWRAAIDEMGTHYYRTTRPIPVVDPYTELKAAHAAGKVIQTKHSTGEWTDCSSFLWNLPPECYRVKPDPVFIDLVPEDIEPGSAIKKAESGAEFYMILSAYNSGYVTYADYEGDIIGISFSDLRKNNWLIHRPSSPGLWQRCEKLAPA